MFSKKNKINVSANDSPKTKIIYKDRTPKTPRITIFINNNVSQEQKNQQTQTQEQEAKQINEKDPGCLERLFCC